MIRRIHLSGLAAALLAAALAPAGAGEPPPAQPPVFVRFRQLAPAETPYFVRFRVRLHHDPWYTRTIVIPEGADRDASRRAAAGAFTPWTDITAMTHGRTRRCGGVAELPGAEATFVVPGGPPGRRVGIELAAAPDEARVVRRLEETAAGETVMFLVSRDLERDAADLETGTQMSQRHLAWAREATGGRRIAPTRMMIATGIWGSPDAGLSRLAGEALWQLGFNVVGGTTPEILEAFDFGTQDALWADVGPAVAREGAAAQVRKLKPSPRLRMLVYSDEVRAPGVGNLAAISAPDDPKQAAKVDAIRKGTANFRRWLAAKGVDPASLGAKSLDDVLPIDTWKEYEARAMAEGAAANRIYYHTCRFRQESATERFRWLTESYHETFPGSAALTATLPADHPYFGGSGLGGGDYGWGDIVACDWFDLARRRAVDLIHVEDWMGLQYMYGPGATWEGFQLMGFQCGIYRSASRGAVPMLALITPSDSRNVQLKAFSGLAQGAKHFWFWHFGPTYMSTENYWSDLRGEYDGVARLARSCAAAEDLIVPGQFRPARIALLYSIASDLWKPFGYAPMLERRLTWFSLVHQQYLVDLLTEEDVAAGRLADCAALYVTDPCVGGAAVQAIRRWTEAGGRLYGSCAAASRDEFNQPQEGLSGVFGIQAGIRAEAVPGPYHARGGLNGIQPRGVIAVPAGASGVGACAIECLGVRVGVQPAGAQVAGTFDDGAPGVLVHDFGKGRAVYTAACPALAYGKGAAFVPGDLKEKWPAALRAFINRPAVESGAPRVVECSSPVVEAGLYESERGIAVTLANFTYEPIPALEVTIPCGVKGAPKVTNVAGDALPFAAVPGGIRVTLPLALSEIVMVRW